MLGDHNGNKWVESVLRSHMHACLPNLKTVYKEDGFSELIVQICIRSLESKSAAIAAWQTASIVNVPLPMQCHVAGCYAINTLTVKLAC